MPWGPSSCEFLLEFWQAETFLGEVAFQCQPSNQSELRILVQTTSMEGCLLLLCFLGVDVFGSIPMFFKCENSFASRYEHLQALVTVCMIALTCVSDYIFLINGFKWSHMQYTYWILHMRLYQVSWFHHLIPWADDHTPWVWRLNANSLPFVCTKHHLQI